MNWIDKLERKFGRFGVENLTMYVIICYVVGYFLTYLNPNLMDMMSLDVAKILHGQVWRLVTWVIYPPSTGNFLLFVISILFFYYPIGTSLERSCGVLTSYSVSLSVGLAYAMSCPDMQILLWFVIPIKMKWMAIVYGAIILYDMITYLRVGLWVMAVPIIASLLNFVLFFFSTRNMQ